MVNDLENSKFYDFLLKMSRNRIFLLPITYFQISFCKYVKSSLLTSSVQLQVHLKSGSAEKIARKVKMTQNFEMAKNKTKQNKTKQKKNI